MYRHILVPLDGSPLAEQVLSHVRRLASPESGARITLLRAIPITYPATMDYDGMLPPLVDSLPHLEAEARSYLEGIATSLQTEGLDVRVEISMMSAAEAILDFAESQNVDLIAIATHGRSGISRWVFGSVTQKVLQATTVPVLVIRPQL
jgi:nucleotide-binding universal stress UspA family protein